MADKSKWIPTKQKRLELGVCIYCGKAPPKFGVKGCRECLARITQRSNVYARENPERTRAYRKRTRVKAIQKYGGKCECCGEVNILFLTIDHKNNDGGEERKTTGVASTAFYLQLLRSEIREDLQVLCFNCNCGKNHNGGICPHIRPLQDRPDDLRKSPNRKPRSKTIWPTDEELQMLISASNVRQVALRLKVVDSVLWGHIRRRGILSGDGRKKIK